MIPSAPQKIPAAAIAKNPMPHPYLAEVGKCPSIGFQYRVPLQARVFLSAFATPSIEFESC
jgi:hypothetical protein